MDSNSFWLLSLYGEFWSTSPSMYRDKKIESESISETTTVDDVNLESF